MTPQQFRIGSYNLFEGAQTTYNRLVEFARDAALDVLCLQEVNGWQNDDAQRCKDFSDKILFLDFSLANTNTEYKIATFTKHAATHKGALVEGFWHGAAVATVKIGEIEVTIVNLHLDPWKEESRVREVGRLLEMVDLTKPTIIVGDFNSLSRDDNYPPNFVEQLRTAGIAKFGAQQLFFDVTDKLRAAGLVDVATQLGVHENTVPSNFSTDKDHELPVRIDYIFATPDLAKQAVKIEVLKNELTDAISDHYPLVTTFQFGEAPSAPAPVVAPPPQQGPPPEPPMPDDAAGIHQEADGSVVLPLHLHDHNA